LERIGVATGALILWIISTFKIIEAIFLHNGAVSFFAVYLIGPLRVDGDTKDRKCRPFATARYGKDASGQELGDPQRDLRRSMDMAENAEDRGEKSPEFHISRRFLPLKRDGQWEADMVVRSRINLLPYRWIHFGTS
jgi:hypothetical protein